MFISLFGYKLNEHSFIELEGKIPPEIVPRLYVLSGKKFISKSDFSKSIEVALGYKLSKNHRAIILHEGKRFQLKRIRRSFLSLRNRFLPSSVFMPSLFKSIQLRPLFFAIWFRSRLLKYFGIMALKRKQFVRELIGGNKQYIGQPAPGEVDVLSYNMGQVLDFHDSHRYRTERIILLLRVLCGRDIKQYKVLSVGPRNEAELLLFSLYGFSLKNIMGIDLFSYSPLIHVMDMHNLDFLDNTFDIYYSAFTLAYSQDVKQACSEAIRVTKDGGLIVITMTLRGVALLVNKETELTQGVEDTLKLFHPNIQHVYFQEDYEWKQDQIKDSEKRFVTVIFSVKKLPA